ADLLAEDGRQSRLDRHQVVLLDLVKRHGGKYAYPRAQLSSVELHSSLNLLGSAGHEGFAGHRVGAKCWLERRGIADVGRKTAIEDVIDARAISKLVLVGGRSILIIGQARVVVSTCKGNHHVMDLDLVLQIQAALFNALVVVREVEGRRHGRGSVDWIKRIDRRRNRETELGQVSQVAVVVAGQ